MKRTAVRKKRPGPPRKGRLHDEKYLEWIRRQWCACCEGELGPAEAAHVGERGMSQKSSDHETIPLCQWHHTLGPHSHHRLGKGFWDFWDFDRDALIASLRERYLAENPPPSLNA